MIKTTIYLFILLFLLSCIQQKNDRVNPTRLDARNDLIAIQDLMVINAGEAELKIDSLLRLSAAHKDDSLYAASLLAKGQNAIYLGDFEKFDSCLNEVLKIDFRGNETLHAETYIALAEQSNYLGDYEQALQESALAERLLSYFVGEELDLYLMQYKIALIKGLSYFAVSQKDSMQYCMNQALSLAEKLERKSNVLFVYSYLGYMYSHLNEYEKAEEYLLKTYEIADEIGNNEAKSAALISLAGTYIGIGVYEKAVEKSNLALAIEQEEMNAEGKLSYIYNHRSEALLQLNKITEAIDDARQALKYSLQLQDQNQIIAANYNLGNGYFKNNNLALGKQYIEEALNNLDQSATDIKTKEKIYKTYATLSAEAGDAENALKYAQLTTLARDSINMNERFNMIQELEMEYETEKKEYELKLANQTIKTHRQLHLSLVSLGIVILASLFVFHYYRRRQRRTEMELLQKSEAAAQAKLKMLSHYKAVDEIKIVSVVKNNEKEDTDVKPTNGNENGVTLTIDKVEELIGEINKQFKVHKVHLDSSLTLSSFADKIGTNTTYLSNVLNQALNSNFTSLVNFYRIEEAKELLMQQATENAAKVDKLDAIASKCGFRSVSAFHANFKKETGMTPGQYKKTF